MNDIGNLWGPGKFWQSMEIYGMLHSNCIRLHRAKNSGVSMGSMRLCSSMELCTDLWMYRLFCWCMLCTGQCINHGVVYCAWCWPVHGGWWHAVHWPVHQPWGGVLCPMLASPGRMMTCCALASASAMSSCILPHAGQFTEHDDMLCTGQCISNGVVYQDPHTGQFIHCGLTLHTGQCIGNGMMYQDPHAGHFINYGPTIGAGQCISNGL